MIGHSIPPQTHLVILPDPATKWAFRLALAFLSYQYLKPIIDTYSPDNAVSGHIGNIVAIGLILILSCSRSWLRSIWRSKMHVQFLYLAIMALLVSSLLSTHAEWADISSALYAVTTCWILYMEFRFFARVPSYTRAILICLTILGFMNAAGGLASAFTGKALLLAPGDSSSLGSVAASGRAIGFRGENYVGFWVCPALIASLATVFCSRRSPRMLASSLFFAICFAGILVSKSRSSLNAAITGILCWLLLSLLAGHFRLSARKCLILVVFFATTYWVCSHSMSALYSHYTETAWSYQRGKWTLQGTANDSRLPIWNAYLRLAMEHPALGSGPGTIRRIVEGGGLIPHNSLLDIAVEYGGIGLAIYILPFALIAIRLSQHQRSHRSITSSATLILVASLVGMCSSLMSLSNPFAKLLWITAGSIDGLFDLPPLLWADRSCSLKQTLILHSIDITKR